MKNTINVGRSKYEKAKLNKLEAMHSNLICGNIDDAKIIAEQFSVNTITNYFTNLGHLYDYAFTAARFLKHQISFREYRKYSERR